MQSGITVDDEVTAQSDNPVRSCGIYSYANHLHGELTENIAALSSELEGNGYRQFNTAYVEIPKKMGKSELAAAVALLLCCSDDEQRAEVYGCAADRQQASIVFEVAADMVRMNRTLNRVITISKAQKRITYNPTNSFYDGFRVPAETIIASVHAYFEPKNATEKWTNRASLKDASALFRFRFIPGVPIDNRMVIDCLGERYNIISVENVQQKNMYYEVTGKVDDTHGKNESEDA